MTIVSVPMISFAALQMHVDVEGMAQQGNHAIFQARAIAKTPRVLSQIERRERTILLLMDGKRTLQEVARLAGRHELEVAWILVHLLARGYIEYLGAEEGGEQAP